ncbi:hypothetical protein [Pseudovibrio sp. SPO723]|uniref:hypothetical protein n=1 Tax=Nesiotobacter zosterae TaxID=392721 RepID=UPI0029C2D9BF|nr:hypothetical protein [Pseudovibrio sp. SPO723]MDX5592565.1 hypothetical protein [Pseudovibrio sp. SPO723]
MSKSVMKITIKTPSYSECRNYRAITNALDKAGYDYKHTVLYAENYGFDGVRLETEAPLSAISSCAYNRHAVEIEHWERA